MNKTILVVEDEPQMRQVLGHVLQRLGYKARTAPDGATALCLARAAAPYIDLLDVDLPDGSGFDLCRTLKSCPRPGLPPRRFLHRTGYPGRPPDRRPRRRRRLSREAFRSARIRRVPSPALAVVMKPQRHRPACPPETLIRCRSDWDRTTAGIPVQNASCLRLNGLIKPANRVGNLNTVDRLRRVNQDVKVKTIAMVGQLEHTRL